MRMDSLSEGDMILMAFGGIPRVVEKVTPINEKYCKVDFARYGSILYFRSQQPVCVSSQTSSE